MPKLRVCAIPGDGIGQEVIPAAMRVLQALPLESEIVAAEAGWDCFQRYGTALPEETIQLVTACGRAMFGATSSPSTKVAGYRSPILGMRQQFELYANLRPTKSLPLSEAGCRAGVDLLIVRENTEDLYVGRERREGDTAIAERVITVKGSQRIAQVAFQLARQRKAQGKPGVVTILHKANVLKETDGLFRQVCLEVAQDFPDIQAQEMLVDAAAMWLVKDPTRFDVLVTTNMFGDILSDEAAGLVGGLGVAPSANIGEYVAIFEPVHGSAPDIAGKGIANPVGAILSLALLLEHAGVPEMAQRLEGAVEATLAAGIRTPDIGGKATTAEVTAAIIGRLAG
ncbi:MAG: isocitrate/isopropylmalate dehydrogenase family protein [Chloroflexi bacterium]|nr:isocitrate/isopropylmalate dehydrogenase family protein [Chloroflexota bacterium]